MKTASQFAEELKAIFEDTDAKPGDESGVVPVPDKQELGEEIADWRGPLQDIQTRLRRMITQDIDKFMESAQKITQRAEESDWSKTVIQNEVARWSRDINKVYADFKNSTQGFQDIVKAMGVPTRRHSTKGKAPASRGKMDWSKLTQVQLKKEVQQQVKRLSAGIHSLADDGAYMLHQIDRILKYKQPQDETVREEIGALFQDFVDFRNAFGSKVWGPYNGLIGRLGAIPAKPIGKYGKEYSKTMRQRPSDAEMVVHRLSASSDLPIDCPELREAIERDRLRATRGVLGEDQEEAAALIGGIEYELLGEAEDKPAKGEAKKMKAKGYVFKILLKDKPPLYAKTEKGAKDVQKDYPGSKIVANESGEIDDPALIEAAEHGDLFDFFEDFDSLIWGDDGLAEEGSEPPFPLSEAKTYRAIDIAKALMKALPKEHKRAARVSGGNIRNDEAGWHAMIGVGDDDKAFIEVKDTRNKSTIAKLQPIESRFVIASVGDVAAAIKKWFGMTWGGAKEGVEVGDDELVEMSQVVKTIFQQMGGGRSMMMIGGQAMEVDGNTLGIKWPSRHRARIGNYVEIRYAPGADLYDMEFFNVSPQGKKTVKKFKRIYNDMLVDTFENHTHWYMRL